MTARTSVELLWIEKQVERWIRFGRIASDTIVDRRRRTVGFDPGSVFALVQWASNNHGTIVSRIDILRAVGARAPVTTVPSVAPGGELLLHQSGWPKVEIVLAAIDTIEAQDIEPEHVCPDHWRHLHHRLAARQAPRAYSRERHAAWLKRRTIEP